MRVHDSKSASFLNLNEQKQTFQVSRNKMKRKGPLFFSPGFVFAPKYEWLEFERPRPLEFRKNIDPNHQFLRSIVENGCQTRSACYLSNRPPFSTTSMIIGESLVIPAAFLLQFKISYKNTPPIWLLKEKLRPAGRYPRLGRSLSLI